MMKVTTTFLRGEVAASNQVRKKTLSAWKQQEARRKQSFERREDFRNQQRSEQSRDKFTLLIKSPKEILALEKGNFKTPPPMTTPVEKRNNKFCEFYGEVGHNTDEYMHLRRQIEELIKAGKPFSPNPKISFPHLGDEDRTKGPMIIEAEIKGHFIHRIYLDGGSASEILYEHCFNRLRSELKNQMVPATTTLIGFSEEIIWPMGQILLLVKIGDAKHSTFTRMNFVVVRSPSLYNGIIGRLGVRKIQAVPSTAHRMLKFPVPGGVLTLKSNRIIQLECTMVFGLEAQPSSITQAAEERIKVEIRPEFPEQTIAIGSTLTAKGRKALYELLRRNIDIFAWKHEDMTGEVAKLVDAKIMKEVHYHSWLSNPVMVKKHDDSCRMCVNFKDMNKACPKDGYQLPEIDWKVESLCGYPFKCFLDAYKGYHQIKMAREYEEKMMFITSQGIFCNLKVPFGLKNAGATYQRLVDKAFQKKIGRNLEVYMDDLAIKSRTKQEIIRDIKEMFRTLREINMKLNPKKCTFRVEEGMFLGYKLNTKGIKVCPDKVEAVLSMPSLKCLKDVHKLNGKLASLNRFLSKKTADLGEYDIMYKPRTSVKGKILADFIVECLKDESLVTTTEAVEELQDPWTLFTDGSSYIDGSRAALILTNPEGIEFTYVLIFATNNEAEYEALIADLRIAEQMGIKNLKGNVDSRLVANQVKDLT
nr:reverse transcriptase domain-containing protein [Tanacetum cinerariifolium]